MKNKNGKEMITLPISLLKSWYDRMELVVDPSVKYVDNFEEMLRNAYEERGKVLDSITDDIAKLIG